MHLGRNGGRGFFAIGKHTDGIGRFRKKNTVRNRMEMSPSLCTECSPDLFVGNHFHIIRYQFVPPVRLKDMSQIQHHPAVGRVAVGVFMKSYPIGGCKRYVDTEIIQADFIQSRRSLFGFFRKGGYGFDGIASREGK